MNKVYNFSKNLLKLAVPLSVILGISSCSTYQSASNVESDGVYYNPNTDKTYAQVEVDNSPSPNGIKIGNPYFDENGNGAEDFFYGDDTNTDANKVNVNVNNYGYGYGYNYFPSNVITLSASNTNWGRYDGVNINIYSNPFNSYWGWGNYGLWRPFGFGFNWGWSNFYYPYNYWGWNYGYNWGMYNRMYGYGYTGYWGGFYNNYWGYYPGNYYGYRNYSKPIIAGSRPSNGLIDPNRGNRPNNLIRPDQGVRPSQSNNALVNSTRPTNTNSGRDNRPVREVRPNTNINSNQLNSGVRDTRPVREVRPTQQMNNNTRPNTGVRETRPVRENRPNSTPQMERSNQRSTPSYTPSYNNGGGINRGGSMGGGSMSAGSSSGTRGSGRR